MIDEKLTNDFLELVEVNKKLIYKVGTNLQHFSHIH